MNSEVSGVSPGVKGSSLPGRAGAGESVKDRIRRLQEGGAPASAAPRASPAPMPAAGSRVRELARTVIVPTGPLQPQGTPFLHPSLQPIRPAIVPEQERKVTFQAKPQQASHLRTLPPQPSSSKTPTFDPEPDFFPSLFSIAFPYLAASSKKIKRCDFAP